MQDNTMLEEFSVRKDAGLPERLRDAREARGWTVEEVGIELKLPASVIAKVEAGQYEDLGAPVYRRGYLRSFARLVGIAEHEVEEELTRLRGEEPALVATGVMPRGEYMVERYLRPATYIALTALIALPVVWWLGSDRLSEQFQGARTVPLQSQSAISMGERTLPESNAPGAVDTVGKELVRASLLPLPKDSMREPVVETTDTSTQPPDADGDATSIDESIQTLFGEGANEAVLILADASWVDVLDGSGQRVHQALLPAGQWRYRSDGPLSFTIGNSSTARLRAAGQPVDLTAHRSPNDVARVQVFAGEG